MKKKKHKIKFKPIRSLLNELKLIKFSILIFLGIILVFIIIAVVVISWPLTPVQKLKEIIVATSTPISTKEIFRGDTSKKQVIFTFDGGAGVQSADKILEVLAKHHVKGTFFLTGKMVETYPDVVKKIAGGGNEIFNHTYDHPYLTEILPEKITEELAKMAQTLSSVVPNISPRPYFRAPYGASDARVLSVAAESGYQSVKWTVDASDWKESEGETAEQVRGIILSSIAPGNIYLMHLGDNITGEILDDVFTAIEAKGYRIVSLAQGI